MPYRITEFESTPNPNALICALDRPISDRPRSFLSLQDAADDPLANTLMSIDGMRTVLLNGQRLTINKHPGADWKYIKAATRRALEESA